MKPNELTDKVALITGDSKGLGKAMSLALAQTGAKIALVSRDEKLLTKTAAAITALGSEAAVFPADVSEEAQVLALEKTVTARFGHRRRLWQSGRSRRNPRRPQCARPRH